MKVITTVQEAVQACREAPRCLGLVPTMGALHDGHLSLVREARSNNATVVVSIFVNPTQFDSGEDCANYPRDLHKDVTLLEKEGVDLMFTPSEEEMYPPSFGTHVEVGGVAHLLEGEHRPGHFRGVATVVTKLFSIIRPNRAYFGQKDGQQVVVVRRLTFDLNLGVEVVVLPTVRELSGLALSSRNAHLRPRQQEAASVLYRALCAAQDCFRAGERDADVLREAVWEVLGHQPMAHSEYVSVADPDTLQELVWVDHSALVSLAVRVGATRLIDNILL